MSRLLRIAARVAAGPARDVTEENPVDSQAVDAIVADLKRELDLLSQAGRRDNLPRLIQRWNKILIGLEGILKLVTSGREEVEKSSQQLIDKLEKTQLLSRPVRLQIR